MLGAAVGERHHAGQPCRVRRLGAAADEFASACGLRADGRRTAARRLKAGLALGDADGVRAASAAEAETTELLAQARADAIEKVAKALQLQNGDDAARLALASEYVAAFGGLGGRSNTIIVPADAASVPSVLGQALGAWDGIRKKEP